MLEMKRTTIGAVGRLFDGPHATPTRRSHGPYFLNIASLKSGRLDLSESDHVSEEDFARWTRRVTPLAGDLLFSYETRLGEAALMPEGVTACLGRRMALLRPDRSIVNPRFLLYFYLSPSFQQVIATNTIHGATVPRIGLATMPAWEIEIPDLATQVSIADALGALDDKIAANDRIIAKARELLAAEFASLQMNDEAKLVSLSELIELNPKVRKPDVEEPVYLDMKNLPDKSMTVTSWGHRMPRGGARFQNGDTLLARITPCLENGKTGYVDFLANDEVGIGSTEFIVMRPRKGIPTAFPYFLAIDATFREYAIKRMVGTSGRQRLSAGDIASFQVRRPHEYDLARFSEVSDALMGRVKAAVDETRVLAAARDELLPLLMSGKIRVREAEKIVEGVV